MQGYFEYSLFGKKADLVLALDKIKELAELDKDYNCLLWFEPSITKKYNSKDYKLTMGMPESGNISHISFLYEDMMDTLCKDFSEFDIEGTGYDLDSPPYPIWTSKKGSKKYDTEYESINIEEYLSISDITDNDGIFIEGSSINIECSGCYEELELELNSDCISYSENGELINYDYIIKCDTCSCEYQITLFLED